MSITPSHCIATHPATNGGKRATIIAATRRLCTERDFAALTVGDIAQYAGITRTLFYHYFPDKDALADAIIDDATDDILNQVRIWDRDRTPGDISKALDDVIRLLRVIVNDDSPLRHHMTHNADTDLYSRFINRAARSVSDYMCNSTVRDFAARHPIKIQYVPDTFYMLIVGLIALIRIKPDISDDQLASLAAYTLHLDAYLGDDDNRDNA